MNWYSVFLVLRGIFRWTTASVNISVFLSKCPYWSMKEDTPLLEMMNADPYDDEKKEALRRDILDSMTGLTKTQLRKLTDAKVGRPGRPVGSKAAARAKTAAVRSAEAEQEMRELIGKLGAFLTRGGKVGMLSAQAREDLHRALLDYAEQLAYQM